MEMTFSEGLNGDDEREFSLDAWEVAALLSYAFEPRNSLILLPSKIWKHCWFKDEEFNSQYIFYKEERGPVD